MLRGSGFNRIETIIEKKDIDLNYFYILHNYFSFISKSMKLIFALKCKQLNFSRFDNLETLYFSRDSCIRFLLN